MEDLAFVRFDGKEINLCTVQGGTMQSVSVDRAHALTLARQFIEAAQHLDKDKNMQVSDNGLKLIKESEGLRLKAYDDGTGTWTIGYGHTRTAIPDMTITQEQADKLLDMDVAEAMAAVARNVTIELNQNQLDALTSFVFNLGEGNFKASTLLKKINAGAPIEEITHEFSRWVYATMAGQKRALAGLVTRRQKEAALYATPTAPQETKFVVIAKPDKEAPDMPESKIPVVEKKDSVKPGYQTTEFAMTAIVVGIFLFNKAVLDPTPITTEEWIFLGAVTGLYQANRSFVKKGT